MSAENPPNQPNNSPANGDCRPASCSLLPCPFCGGKPEVERKGTMRVSQIIVCEDCG
ncbi:MAG: Lar family restriction alleviation protein, partial [Bdellovibrionales bacterium]|nr:Lar family restriction alleviation protein [Bdellovibrionales bacterium]